ncbi:MAG: patatin-like phospholipase family protein, partial [Georgfuchsia sp.]
LKAIRELLPKSATNPFPILVGTSAGAVNAVVLATHARNFAVGVEGLLEVWRNFHAEQVYRADPVGIAATAIRWLGALTFGWLTHRSPYSLLDNSPLRRLLNRYVNLLRIDDAISHEALRAISITCSGYNSGESVSFFQGCADIEPWRRSQRVGTHAKIELDHLMASSAIPFVFPAVKLHREYFGDGSMRQLAPISPAIHLGAEKILVIAAGRKAEEHDRPDKPGYPSLAKVAGHALSSIFLDSLWMDLERMTRINQTLSMIPEEERQQNGTPLRPIEVLVISPSQRLDHLAAKHAYALPWPVRALLRGIGAMNPDSGALVSYLLFEPPYTHALIELGYGDTMARKDEVRGFLSKG